MNLDRLRPLVVVLLLVPSAAAATATGQVLDPDGRPIRGAEVCVSQSGGALDCVKTDAAGYYRIATPSGRTLVIRASGFVPLRAVAVEQVAPITLSRAATLTVRVIDAATGEPVPSGKVRLIYTSGKSIGDAFPFNRDGVRIRTLTPGEILARCEAEGFDPGGPEVVILEGGAEKTLTIAMRRHAKPPR